MCNELATESWQQAWTERSPHRQNGNVYASLARAAAKAFAKPRTALAQDKVHWPDFSVVQPAGENTFEFTSPLSSPEARQHLLSVRSALDAFAVALICDVVRQARERLPAGPTVAREESKGRRSGHEDPRNSLVERYNLLVHRVAATFHKLSASPDYSAARTLSSARCMRKELIPDSLLGRDSLIPKIREHNYEPAIRVTMHKVAELAEIVHGRDLERFLVVHANGGDGEPRKGPKRPKRQGIQDAVARLKGLKASCRVAPLPEIGSQALDNTVDAARKKLEGEVAINQKAEAKRDRLLEALDKLEQLLEDCLRRDEIVEAVTRDGLADYDILLRSLKEAFDGESRKSGVLPPLLPRLLADVISRVDAWAFEDALQTTLVTYVAPRIRGSFKDYFDAKLGARQAALRRYEVIFAAAQAYCRNSLPSVTRPIELHLVSRVWLLATLFRSASATNNASERGANLLFSKALLGLAICEHESAQELRYDYVEAVPYWMQELGKELVTEETLGQVNGLLFDLAESMHWTLLNITEVSTKRPKDSHLLISEGSIHKDYKRACKVKRNYSPNKALAYLGLETVDLSKVEFSFSGKPRTRSKKSSATGRPT